MSGTTTPATTTPAQVTTITVAGNNILPPPRLSGDPQQDTQVLLRWMNDLYDRLVKVANVIGTLSAHEARISALEPEMGTALTAISAIQKQIVTIKTKIGI